MSDRRKIKKHLADHGLRLGTQRGERVLQQHDPATGWQLVARRVRSWATALSVAVTLGLCPAMRGSDAPALGDESFAAAQHEVRTAKGQDAIKLLDYQQAAIEDQSRIVILCWCRQAGKDFTTSLKAVLDAMETGDSWYIVSLTQRQALATAKKAQMHARAISGVLPKVEAQDWQYQRDNGDAFTITSYGVKLKNGAEIVALPGKDPDALAGLTGNVIFTEMALFPNEGRDHWRVVFPLATRGYKIWAISTPRGPETRFSQLRRNPSGNYSVHDVTIYDAVEGGLELKDEQGNAITPEELEAIYADPQGWEREYLCIEGEDHDALIDWGHINALTSTDCTIDVVEINGKGKERWELSEQFDETTANSFFRNLREEMEGRPVLGWDIAVKGDLSVLPYGEKLGDVVWPRAMIVMRHVDDFEYQEEVVSRAMETGATGVGDASGLGMEACQRLTKRFGESRFTGLQFTTSSKTELFVQFRDEVQRAHLRIPHDNEIIRYDIHSLARTGVGVAQRLQVLTLRNPLEQQSHADIATALALMMDAAQSDGGPVFGETVSVTGRGTSAESDYDRRGLFRDRTDENELAPAGAGGWPY